MAEPAATKLRIVLDYLPCEACLAQPVQDQELLCSICRRVDRQIGVSVAVHTTVLLDRPTEPGPVVIPPAPSPPSLPPPQPVEGPRVGIEILLEEVVEEPAFAAVAAPSPVEPEGPMFDDVASFEAPQDVFDFTPPPRPVEAAPPPPPRVEPPVEAAPAQDDFVFRPPAAETAPYAPREEEPTEDWLPDEEVPVVPEKETRSPWAPPAEEALLEDTIVEESIPEEPPSPAPVEEEAIATTLVDEEPLEATVLEEEPILEATVVEEEEPIVELEPVEDEVFEASIVEDEAAPVDARSDLWRLRGFDRSAEQALAGANVRSISHLSGHDPVELAGRTGLDASRLAAWVQAADLVEEVGVPVDAALALVSAGVEGPRGLRDTDAQAIADKVSAFGGASIPVSDIKRWKRRA